MSKGWDNATLKKLKALTCKGLSTSEIGKRLGMSKNAIVGKLNRLGWNAKAGGAASADIPDVDSKKTAKESATKTAAAKKAPAKPVAAVAKKTATKPVTKKSPVPKIETPKVDVKKTVAKKEVSAKKTADSETNVAAAKNMAVHQRIIQHSLEMANLKPNQCRWPIGDPDSEDFHFCGETVFVGKPYCYEHCKQAYQFTAPPKKK
jgi:GcrA cell cycle regulator